MLCILMVDSYHECFIWITFYTQLGIQYKWSNTCIVKVISLHFYIREWYGYCHQKLKHMVF